VTGLSGASLALLVNSVASFNRVSSSALCVGLESTENYLTGRVLVLRLCWKNVVQFTLVGLEKVVELKVDRIDDELM
jgi:hypothetical protein